MFVSEKIVFIELHKTGCTHIGKLLSNLLDGRQIGKHNPATSNLFENQQLFLGSVRDPWEWYVSLWAYGCDKKGAIYGAVTKGKNCLRGRGWRYNPIIAAYSLLKYPRRNPNKWKHCYSDVNDIHGFRNWLYMMHDKRCWNDFGEGYSLYPMRKFAGLLTYRYLKLFCLRDFKNITSLYDLKGFEKNNCYIDYFIRNEHLEKDFIKALELCGIELSDIQKNKIFYCNKTNTSSRKEKARYYYDNDTIALVNDREQLIIEKFGYTPPIV